MDVLRSGRPPSHGIPRLGRRIAVTVVGLLLVVAAFVAGTVGAAPAPDPVRTHDGVPVVVDHTPAGAVLAADEYLSTEQASVERDPTRFAALVAEDYASPTRASALAEAATDRDRDPKGMRLWAEGGEGFTLIGAHRLDGYLGNSARVTAWAGQLFWGPGQPPCQVWALGQLDLVWRDGRWQVVAMRTVPNAAPAPASLPQAAPSNDTGEAFSSVLAGFSPVAYGSAR